MSRNRNVPKAPGMWWISLTNDSDRTEVVMVRVAYAAFSKSFDDGLHITFAESPSTYIQMESAAQEFVQPVETFTLWFGPTSTPKPWVMLRWLEEVKIPTKFQKLVTKD